MTVLKVGETMALLDPLEDGQARLGMPLTLRFVVDVAELGFAYGLLEGWDPADCGHAGNVIAARALASTGDWATLPRLEGVRADLHRGAANRRRRHSSPSAASDAGRPDSRSSPG